MTANTNGGILAKSAAVFIAERRLKVSGDYVLTIFWRAGGEETKSFKKEGDAIKELHLLELLIGTRIIKMELSKRE